jgi:hypothetical protein
MSAAKAFGDRRGSLREGILGTGRDRARVGAWPAVRTDPGWTTRLP